MFETLTASYKHKTGNGSVSNDDNQVEFDKVSDYKMFRTLTASYKTTTGNGSVSDAENQVEFDKVNT